MFALLPLTWRSLRSRSVRSVLAHEDPGPAFPNWLETFLGAGAIPRRSPLALFIWGDQRAVPVRVSRLGISEAQHDPALHPIRAAVDVELEVVTDRDLPQNDELVRVWRRYLEKLRDMAELGFSRLP